MKVNNRKRAHISTSQRNSRTTCHHCTGGVRATMAKSGDAVASSWGLPFFLNRRRHPSRFSTISSVGAVPDGGGFPFYLCSILLLLLYSYADVAYEPTKFLTCATFYCIIITAESDADRPTFRRRPETVREKRGRCLQTDRQNRPTGRHDTRNDYVIHRFAQNHG